MIFNAHVAAFMHNGRRLPDLHEGCATTIYENTVRYLTRTVLPKAASQKEWDVGVSGYTLAYALVCMLLHGVGWIY